MNRLPAHGVLIQLEEMGVYLIGHSGVGKSETALQLIHQGALLICDDAPEFTADKTNNELRGNCPNNFYGLMHIRDLGIINIMQLMGRQYFKASQKIDFVIELIKAETHQQLENCLSPNYRQWHYKDEEQQSWTIPGIRIHLLHNRNMPLMITTAVRQFALSRTAKPGCPTANNISDKNSDKNR